MSTPENGTSALQAGELVESLHLGLAAAALESLGIFAALQEPSNSTDLAQRYDVDREILEGTLRYLSLRSDLVEADGEAYAIGPGYDVQSGFLLNLYGGAFAPNAAKLEAILRDPEIAFETVNRAAQARAFAHAPKQSVLTIAGIIQQLEFGNLLDLGCGSGLLLTALAEQDGEFTGWGIDMNPEMCSAANKKLQSIPDARNIAFAVGDVRELEWPFPGGDREKVQTIFAGDLINEMFRGGGDQAAQWLSKLAELFPDRVLIVSDYYGQLNSENPAADPLMLLHDFSQVISGQGVPPPDLEGWTALYEAADCQLAHAIEDDGSSRFIHIVQL